MAAVLKKRALAEYSHVIQQEKRAPKKLRLVKRPSISLGIQQIDEHMSNLRKTHTAQQTIGLLNTLAQALDQHLQQVEDMDDLVENLVQICCQQEESAVRVKIYLIIRTIAEGRDLDNMSFLDDLLSCLRRDHSHKSLAAGLSALLAIGKNSITKDTVTEKILQFTKERLEDGSHIVVQRCIQVLSSLTPETKGEEAMNIISSFTKHQDPRVRASAFTAMISLHARGVKLDPDKYVEICESLNDDYETVRKAALDIISTLAQNYPDRQISYGEDSCRLLDDAFGKICNCISDLSVSVRAHAAELLGRATQGVSHRFLEQTLDKKLMSNMRRKATAHERSRDMFFSGDWSSGKKWADDAPKEKMDVESVAIISFGACGAFVHGLEDEFLEVRRAAVESLCKLACNSPVFARLCIDFLVDMFNDEIEEVRLKAIGALKTISSHIVFREDQLEIMLALLEESSLDIRESLHSLMSSIKLSTKACLKMSIARLEVNLNRYPQDRRSIWRALKSLGANHPELTLPLVPELLGIHPYFDTPEPDVDDPHYMCMLILVLNAASSCPTMLPLLEEHTIKHYHYFRDSLPHLVPLLKFDCDKEIESRVTPTDVECKTREFLQQVLKHVSSISSLPHATRRSRREKAISDLQKLADIQPQINAAAHAAACYIQVQMQVDKAVCSKVWNAVSSSTDNSTEMKDYMKHLLNITLKLQHLFSDMCVEETACIKLLRLQVLALQLVYIVRGSNVSALSLTESFTEQADHLQRFVYEAGLPSDLFLDAVCRELDTLEEPKPGAVVRLLEPLLQQYPLTNLKLTSQIKEASAVIYEPSGDSDNPLKFTAGLILGVPLDCEVSNVTNISLLRIEVTYPDLRSHLIIPRPDDLRQVSDGVYRLLTTVCISHQVWSEPCHVELCVVLDISELEANSSSKLYTTTPTLQLASPVKVYVNPKPIKKGTM